MALTISTNTSAATAHRYLRANDMDASSSLAKLSSGSRIVKASDDAAGLAVGTKLRADVTALKQGLVNANHGVSLLQVADGGMARIGDILQRMKALSVQSASGSVSNSERSFLNQEFTQLRTQIGDIASQTKFNSTVLLNGTATQAVTQGATTIATGAASVSLSGASTAGTYTLTYDGTDTFSLSDGAVTDTVQVTWAAGQVVYDGAVEFKDKGLTFNFQNFDVTDGTLSVASTVAGTASMDFQVGIAAADTVAVTLANVGTGAGGLNIGGNTVDTLVNAQASSTALDGAISTLNAARAGVGSVMSRFEYIGANLATSIENLDAARSTLMDVDVAAEMSNFSAKQVLMQASVSMLAQANQMPQNLLKLLG